MSCRRPVRKGAKDDAEATPEGTSSKRKQAASKLPGKPFEGTVKAGKKVNIEWGGRWWPGKIVKLGRGRCHISYDGWSAAWNEAVGADRLRLPART